jgi:hypothetical protein
MKLNTKLAQNAELCDSEEVHSKLFIHQTILSILMSYTIYNQVYFGENIFKTRFINHFNQPRRQSSKFTDYRA